MKLLAAMMQIEHTISIIWHQKDVEMTQNPTAVFSVSNLWHSKGLQFYYHFANCLWIKQNTNNNEEKSEKLKKKSVCYSNFYYVGQKCCAFKLEITNESTNKKKLCFDCVKRYLLRYTTAQYDVLYMYYTFIGWMYFYAVLQTVRKKERETGIEKNIDLSVSRLKSSLISYIP